MSDTLTPRERNRLEMPETAALLDELRARFGTPARFSLTENGRTVEWGAALPDREVPAAPVFREGVKRERVGDAQ
jgi:hypothetical protein